MEIPHVTQGTPLARSASRENAYTDAANDYTRRRYDTSAGTTTSRKDAWIVWGRNTSSTTPWSQFAIAGLGDPIFEPGDNAFTHAWGFDLVDPTEGERFGILQEPVRASSGGDQIMQRALLLGGVSPASVLINDTAHTRAKAMTGDRTSLESADNGPAEILWWESGEVGDTVQALVLLDSGSGTEAAVKQFRHVEFFDDAASSTFPGLYAARVFTENNNTAGAVEFLPEFCWAYPINSSQYKPTLGRLYEGRLTDNKVKVGNLYVYTLSLDCCDAPADPAYSGSGSDGDGPPDDPPDCPSCYVWDAVADRCVWICGPTPASCECVPGAHPAFNVTIGSMTATVTYNPTLGYYPCDFPAEAISNECLINPANWLLRYTCNSSGDEDISIEVLGASYCYGYVDLVISDCDPWTAEGSLSFKDIGPDFGFPPDSCQCDETTTTFPVTITKA